MTVVYGLLRTGRHRTGNTNRGDTDSRSGIIEIVSTISDTFEVFSPKLFKGMKESTALTRHLASQGLKVKLRTDTTVGRQ
jgi:hypothetical protein